MKNFYFKTAINNLKKNLRLYIPQILSGTMMFSIFYIMLALSRDEAVRYGKGSAYIPTFMSIGSAVMMILSVVMAFYSNSFLMKRRIKEYGLYNVLGLEKKHIILIMFYENMISFISQILGGVIVGVSFYRLSTLLIASIVKSQHLQETAWLVPSALIVAIEVFCLIFVLTFVFNIISLVRLKPAELIKASSTGEKEPKIKWILFILGVICLGTGYGISLTIESPIKAIMLFFVAVILVVIGTYFLFTAGSIFILKMLKKNKNYYYRPEHMISVSGMLYRMKQNAAGLASIAILATGVLIMISSTISLYHGIEKSVVEMYPKNLYFNVMLFDYDSEGNHRRITEEEAERFLEASAKEAGVTLSNFAYQKSFETAYFYEDGELKCDLKNNVRSSFYEAGFTDPRTKCITFMEVDCYNALVGGNLVLAENEMATGGIFGSEWDPGEVRIAGLDLKCKERLKDVPVSSEVGTIMECTLFVVNSDVFQTIFDEQTLKYGDFKSEIDQQFAVDVEGDEESLEQFEEVFYEILAKDFREDDDQYMSVRWNSSWGMRSDLYDMDGSLMFLGILLSIVCLIATAIIIYYKQISEGYEDRNNFQIMQKVGLSREEIKKTIHSQILTVFFMPLAIAGVHTLVAYRLVKKLINLITIGGGNSLLLCAGIVFVVFSMIYIVIYSVTAKTYYKIVR